jgi:putative hydrolase of the HAD superfamily
MIKLLGLDADDTLWHNESIFARAQERYRALLARFHAAEEVDRALFATEMRNLRLYGYGVKGFMLSSIEAAIQLSGGKVGAEEIKAILDLGQEMLAHPVELLPGVAETLPGLAADYRLLLITKGDLHHQERKVAESGLTPHFHAIEIVSEKDPAAYERVLRRHGARVEEFAMVGNSLKSDILPVLQLGGVGVHVPYHIIWAHEHIDEKPEAHERFRAVESFAQLPQVLAGF